MGEAGTVKGHWKTSLHVGGLVTMVAAVHGMYMREYWVQVKETPIVYRYIDWSITVPLQMIEFDLILKAAKCPGDGARFWKLLVGTVIMLLFGYLGETKVLNQYIGFAVGMCGWGFILFEIFMGSAGKGASEEVTDAVKQSFSNMPLLVASGPETSKALNVIYNIADFANKIGFVLACWSCAKSESEETKAALLA